jgi:twitching motility protein PilJ
MALEIPFFSRKKDEAPAEPTKFFEYDPEVYRGAKMDKKEVEARLAQMPGGLEIRLGKAPEYRLPVIGHLPRQRQERYMLTLLVVSFVMVLVFGLVQWQRSYLTRFQIDMAADAFVTHQSIGKGMSDLLSGTPGGGALLEKSHASFNKTLVDLDQTQSGEHSGAGETYGYHLYKPDAQIIDQTKKIALSWQEPNKALTELMTRKEEIRLFESALVGVKEIGPRILQLGEQLTDSLRRGNASASDIAAAQQLRVLSHRIGQNLEAMMQRKEGADAPQLSRDMTSYLAIVDGFMNGNSSLNAVRDADARARLTTLRTSFIQYQQSANILAASASTLQAIKQAEQSFREDNVDMREELATLKDFYWQDVNQVGWPYWMITLFVLITIGAIAGLVVVQLQGSIIGAREAEGRRREADERRLEAQRQEEEARAINERNQQAILRLMNELQEVADGNLTVQATVSEDVTGAIADSINYTIEELRILVGRVTATAEQVTSASTQAQKISTELIAASEQQSQDILGTGQAVLKMADDITEVSLSASESAEVARQSLAVAAQGAIAVQNTIKGMDEIRMQIQETAKRIKRLGESSQQIGEITELISDITEQTNVLALNAAIQAASAGEAGRGFSVVAEEVQRLAERSANATRQIGALVRTIQTDTQEAVAAMENSTQEVVEGAKLSDAAGSALNDISRVSNHLAELIQKISNMTEQQAVSAGSVAQSIQGILGVTEQTQRGTHQTAQSIQQLNLLAEELKNSVSRFQVAA